MRVLTPEQRAHKSEWQRQRRKAVPATPEQVAHTLQVARARRAALPADRKAALDEKEATRSRERRERLPLEGPSIRMFYLFKRTLDDYDRVLEEQGGVCACCSRPPGERRFCWDHDHQCCPGKRSCGECVRGLVCIACNVRIGYLETDNSAQLAYIEKWKTP